MPAVFITQQMLQTWADQGKVSLEETTLLLIKEQRKIDLIPAVRVTEVIGGEADPHGLVGKVKSLDQIRGQGGEHYMDSLILEDVAYQVVEGFLGDLTGGRPVSKPTLTAPAPVDVAPRAAASTEVSAPANDPTVIAPPITDSGVQAEASGSGEGLSEAERLSKLFLDTVG